VILASLLSFFVPQDCGEGTTEKPFNTPCEPEDNINFSDPSFTMFNKLVVVVNFLLVACFAVLYYIENERETWLSTCVPTGTFCAGHVTPHPTGTWM
jgi:hypothetical protein